MNSMSFMQVLNVAERNKAASKRLVSNGYSTSLAPPKKFQKSNVGSAAIKNFLAKKQAEEEEKAIEAKQKRETLLSLRAKSTKNNKKAKIMASRTKDNDFSRIKLTEDEVEAKKKREAQLLQLELDNKVKRMKARIELEEKEKLLPRKRKRKSKHKDGQEVDDGNDDGDDNHLISEGTFNKESSGNSKVFKKKPGPPVQMLKYEDLIKLAATKQFEPLKLPEVKQVEEEKLLTKKEKKLLVEQEKRRIRQRLAIQGFAESPAKTKSLDSDVRTNKDKSVMLAKKPMPTSSNNHQRLQQKLDVKRTEKDNQGKSLSKIDKDPSKSKMESQRDAIKVKSKSIQSVQKLVNDDTFSKALKQSGSSKSPSNSVKTAPPSKSPKPVVKKSNPNAETAALQEALRAEMEKRIRAEVQLEFEVKMKKQEAINTMQKPSKSLPPGLAKPPSKVNLSPSSKAHPTMPNKKPFASNGIKPMKRPPPPKLPKTPEFHMNPYVLPPRRLLEPQRPHRPIKRRIESDEEEEEDDDDMNDFIDDETAQVGSDAENYSQCIKEIFGYDRSRYMDFDDDDIMESSYAQQMKEESQSARIGKKEDLEELKKEQEELKRIKMKMKKKKS